MEGVLIEMDVPSLVSGDQPLVFPELFKPPNEKNDNLSIDGLSLEDITPDDEILIDYGAAPKMMRKVFYRNKDGESIVTGGKDSTDYLSEYNFTTQNLIFNIEDPLSVNLTGEAFAGINFTLNKKIILEADEVLGLSDNCASDDIYVQRGDLIGIKTKNAETCEVTHYADRFMRPKGYSVPMYAHPGAGGAFDLTYLLKNVVLSRWGVSLPQAHECRSFCAKMGTISFT